MDDQLYLLLRRYIIGLGSLPPENHLTLFLLQFIGMSPSEISKKWLFHFLAEIGIPLPLTFDVKHILRNSFRVIFLRRIKFIFIFRRCNILTQPLCYFLLSLKIRLLENNVLVHRFHPSFHILFRLLCVRVHYIFLHSTCLIYIDESQHRVEVVFSIGSCYSCQIAF